MANPETDVEVLLAEDNINDAELCMRALKKHDFAGQIFWVKDGAEALEFLFHTGRYAERATNAKPKLVLMDLRLPKIDGIEVLRRLKSDEQTKAIPIVILTSATEGAEVNRAYRLGANSYVVKPVDFDSFADLVTALATYWLRTNRPPS